MALKDALSRFLRDKAGSKRSGGGGTQDAATATAFDNAADTVESADDPETVLVLERLEGFYLPDKDEFVPTGGAVEIVEGFGASGNDDANAFLRELADAAPAGGPGGAQA
jgi:hypothetical protein